MKKKWMIVLGVVLSLALGLAACAPATTTTEAADTAAAATAAPEKMEESTMALYDFDGNPVDIFADGKPVYLKAWASWCPSCLGGLSELDELFAKDTDFKVVTIVSPGEYGEQSAEDFIKWFDGLKGDFPHVEVLFDENAALMDSLGLRAFPSSYFYNSDGTLAGMKIGHTANSEIEEVMATLK